MAKFIPVLLSSAERSSFCLIKCHLCTVCLYPAAELARVLYIDESGSIWNPIYYKDTKYSSSSWEMLFTSPYILLWLQHCSVIISVDVPNLSGLVHWVAAKRISSQVWPWLLKKNKNKGKKLPFQDELRKVAFCHLIAQWQEESVSNVKGETLFVKQASFVPLTPSWPTPLWSKVSITAPEKGASLLSGREKEFSH